jgi:TRAP-type C4-dicarboxylate transport system permease small subunit
MATTTVRMRQPLTIRDIMAIVWSILVFTASIGMIIYGLLILLRIFKAANISEVAPQLVLGIVLTVAGIIIFPRYLRLLNAIFRKNDYKLARETMVIDFFQLILLVVMASILFPVLWIINVA